ncbi:MAG: hypothetical protein U1E60_11605 [Reyranellaceae bacterium]
MKAPGPRLSQARQIISSELASLKELALKRRAASLKQQMLKIAQLRALEGDINGLRRRSLAHRRLEQLAE